MTVIIFTTLNSYAFATNSLHVSAEEPNDKAPKRNSIAQTYTHLSQPNANANKEGWLYNPPILSLITHNSQETS